MKAEFHLDTKRAELILPLHKQSDDLARTIAAHDGDVHLGLRAYGGALREASDRCVRLAGAVGDCPIEILVDTHLIQVTGPRWRIEGLVADGLLTEHPEIEEDCEEE